MWQQLSETRLENRAQQRKSQNLITTVFAFLVGLGSRLVNWLTDCFSLWFGTGQPGADLQPLYHLCQLLPDTAALFVWLSFAF